MNIECDQETLDELEHSFKFNDAVLRHLTVQMKAAVTAPSPMMKEEKARSVLNGEPPKAAEAPKASDAPKAAEAPKASDAPKAADASKASDAPKPAEAAVPTPAAAA
jgi:hypothetical protein